MSKNTASQKIAKKPNRDGSKSQSHIENLNMDKLKEIAGDEKLYSYKNLCQILNIPRLEGSSKIKQLNEFGCLCEYEKDRTKYRILEIRQEADIQTYRQNSKYLPYIEMILSRLIEDKQLTPHDYNGVLYVTNKELTKLTGLVNENLIYVLSGNNQYNKRYIISQIYGWNADYGGNGKGSELWNFSNTVMNGVAKPIIRSAMKSLDNRRSIMIQKGYKLFTITKQFQNSHLSTHKYTLATSKEGQILNRIVADAYSEFGIKNNQQWALSNKETKDKIVSRCNEQCKKELGYDYFIDCYAITIAPARVKYNMEIIKGELNNLMLERLEVAKTLKSCNGIEGFNNVSIAHYEEMVNAMIRLDTPYDFKKDIKKHYDKV